MDEGLECSADERIHVWMNRFMGAQVGGWVDDCMVEQVNGGWMDKSMSGQVHR
jgi:hypothetical protein